MSPVRPAVALMEWRAAGPGCEQQRGEVLCSCRGLLLLITVIRISPGNVGDVPRDNYSVTVAVGGGTWDNTTDNTFDKTAATLATRQVSR